MRGIWLKFSTSLMGKSIWCVCACLCAPTSTRMQQKQMTIISKIAGCD